MSYPPIYFTFFLLFLLTRSKPEAGPDDRTESATDARNIVADISSGPLATPTSTSANPTSTYDHERHH